jgi:hypothetical protein
MVQSFNNAAWNQVNKRVTKATRKIVKTADEYLIPKTPADIAFTLAGGKGISLAYKGTKLAYKGTKKLVKAVSKNKKAVPTKSPAKTAKKMVKNIKKTKPMESVPTGVSNRYQATLQRLAAEEAKKKKKK